MYVCRYVCRYVSITCINLRWRIVNTFATCQYMIAPSTFLPTVHTFKSVTKALQKQHSCGKNIKKKLKITHKISMATKWFICNSLT